VSRDIIGIAEEEPKQRIQNCTHSRVHHPSSLCRSAAGREAITVLNARQRLQGETECQRRDSATMAMEEDFRVVRLGEEIRGSILDDRLD
jgi:hypothetical protein